MALIELNLEKPALKRTERIERSDATERRRPTSREEQGKQIEESTEVDVETDGSSAGGRGLARKLGLFAIVVSAALAARRVRSRRKSESVDVETDW